MEDASVVIGLFGVLKEVFARFRSEFGEETEMNVSHGRVQNRRLRKRGEGLLFGGRENLVSRGFLVEDVAIILEFTAMI